MIIARNVHAARTTRLAYFLIPQLAEASRISSSKKKKKKENFPISKKIIRISRKSIHFLLSNSFLKIYKGRGRKKLGELITEIKEDVCRGGNWKLKNVEGSRKGKTRGIKKIVEEDD